MADRPLRIGLVGVDVTGRGFGAKAHIPAILAAPNVELTAVCTTKEGSAKASAERYGAKRYYVGIDALLEDPDIDLVNIAVTVRSHYPLVWTALQANKMVYCEWPLGLNPLEANTLANLATQKELLTAVGTQGRFSPAMMYLKSLIQEGFIGRPLFFRMSHFLPRFPVRRDHWWSAMEEEHSGALGVACGHATDTLQSALGPITELSGYAETLRPHDTYADTKEPFMWTTMDTVSYQARLDNGLTGTVHISNLTTQQMGFELEVFGEKGQLRAAAPYYVSYSPISLYALREGEDEVKELEIPKDFYLIPDLSEESAGYNIAQALVSLRQAWLKGEAFEPSFSTAHSLHKLLHAIKTSWAQRTWLSLE